MENNIFLRPAVAGVMKANFVEARVHTDTMLPEEQLLANRKLQLELADTSANPSYVVVEPKSGRVLGRHFLSGGPGAWEGLWIEFLERMLREAGRGESPR
jgi:hypothetical protein